MRQSTKRWGVTLIWTIVICVSVAVLSGSATRSLVVTATAYNSHPGQTNAHPWIGAWGDRMKPGMKAIAVSRDLLEKGLRRNVEVEIEGLPGVYRVRDKMGRRWKRRIDVYMGSDEEAARAWGVRKVRIRW